jgi:hypothetical protein
MLVLDKHYTQMTVDFEERTAILRYSFVFEKKRRRKLWVHPLSSQRLLKGQIHEIYRNLRAYSKNKYIFQFNIKFLFVIIALFTTFSHCESTKKASGLDPIVDVYCRTEYTPERLFGRSCARSSSFTFVSFAKATDAPQTKWGKLHFSNRHGKLYALAPRPICVNVFYSKRVNTRNL